MTGKGWIAPKFILSHSFPFFMEKLKSMSEKNILYGNLNFLASQLLELCTTKKLQSSVERYARYIQLPWVQELLFNTNDQFARDFTKAKPFIKAWCTESMFKCFKLIALSELKTKEK